MRLDRWLGGRTVIKELFRRLSCKVLSSPPRGPAHYIGFRWMHFWAGYQKSPTPPPPVWNSVRGRHLFNWIDQIPSVLQDWPGHHHWLRAHVVCYKSKWMDAAAVTFSCGGPLRQMRAPRPLLFNITLKIDSFVRSPGQLVSKSSMGLFYMLATLNLTGCCCPSGYERMVRKVQDGLSWKHDSGLHVALCVIHLLNLHSWIVTHLQR